MEGAYIRMPYLTPLGTLSGMRIKNENIKDKTNRYVSAIAPSGAIICKCFDIKSPPLYLLYYS